MTESRDIYQDDDEIKQIRQEAMDFAEIGLYRFGFDGVVAFMDAGAWRIFELESRFPGAEEVAGRNIVDLVLYTNPVGQMREELRRTGSIHGREWHFKTLDGKDKWVIEDSYLDKDPATGAESIQVILHDVTDRKQAERTALATERRFRETLEAISLIAVQLDRIGKITFCNDYLLKLTGWQRDELLGRDWMETFIPPEMIQDMRQNFFGEAQETGSVPSHYENLIRTREGESRLVYWSNTLTRDDSGAPIGLTCIGEDVTERRRAENALRASERRFRETLETIHIVAAQIDTEGHITFCNDYLLELTGWTREQVLGRDWFEIFMPPELYEEIRPAFLVEATLQSAVPAYYETPLLTRIGGRRMISWSNSLLRDERDNITGLTCIGQDITHRKQAEAVQIRAARVSDRMRTLMVSLNTCRSVEEMLAPLLNATLDVCAMSGGAVYVVEGDNAVIRRHRGMNAEFVRRIECLPVASSVVQAILEANEPLDISYTSDAVSDIFLTHDIRHAYATPLKSGGAVLGFLVLISGPGEDAEEGVVNTLSVIALEMESFFSRLSAEEALRQSEEEYRSTLDFMADAIHLVDQDLRILLCNKTFSQWNERFGFPTDIVGLTILEAFPFLPENVRDEYAHVFTAGETVVTEESTDTRVGKIITESRKMPVWERGKVTRVLTIIRDITSRERALEAVRHSEEKYRTILESIQEGYYEVSLDGDFEFFNTALCKTLGYSEGELMGMNYRECYVDQAQIDHVYRTYENVYRTGQAVQLADWEIRRKDGSIAQIEISISLMTAPNGEPVGFRGIARDVSERKLAERALRESEERYRELFENANDLVYTHDLAGMVTSFNKAGERITGYSREEAVGLPIISAISEEYRALTKRMIARKLEGEEVSQYEIEIIAKDGHRVPIEVSSRLIFQDGCPVGVQGIGRDITERKNAERERERLEAQLRHTQKLEGLGVLAGGIAHDFNNLLAGILGNAGLALMKMPEDSPARNSVVKIEDTAQRAAVLTNQMLAYSGKGTFLV